jgi:hypothetical protein
MTILVRFGRESRYYPTEEPRVAKIPEHTLAKLEGHRKRHDEFRAQFGPD